MLSMLLYHIHIYMNLLRIMLSCNVLDCLNDALDIRWFLRGWRAGDPACSRWRVALNLKPLEVYMISGKIYNL